MKHRAVLWRITAAAALGGAYSLTIFLPPLPAAVSVLLKVAAAALILLTAFRFHRFKSFWLSGVLFLLVNFVFLGVISGIFWLTGSQRIVIHNGVVYLNLDAKELLLSALAAYLLACLAIRIYNRRAAANEIYSLTITVRQQSVTLSAFADTGNRLREPFSGAPVIVADKTQIAAVAVDCPKRLIPAATVGGKAFLEAFQPDEVILCNRRGEVRIEHIYIALGEEMNHTSYGAVFNPEILSV